MSVTEGEKLNQVVATWRATVDETERARQRYNEARAEESRASTALSNALEAEKKAFAALLAARPEQKR